MADSLEGIISGSTRIGSITKAEIIDLISEGEIDGLVSKEYSFSGNLGDVGYISASIKKDKNFLSSIYYNNVPIVDNEGLFNFQDVNVKESIGTKTGSIDTQTKVNDFLEKTKPINEKLRGPSKGSSSIPEDVDYFAKYYRALNKECSAIKLNIKITALQTVNKSTGNIEDNTVQLIVKTRALFSNKEEQYQTNVSQNDEGKISGRISSPFIKSYRIDFEKERSDFKALTNNPDFLGWEIKVYRTTPESITTNTSATTFVDSITEIYKNKFSYPNSATISQLFSSEYFSSLPTRGFDAKLLKIKVPSNYNALTRSYTDPDNWDGTFKTEKEWTDNPAWCFYDLITNERYGLGKYIPEANFDKWTLYEIGKYCDVLVSDGYGGLEHRFSCNVLIQSREDAYKVVQDMASIFRGLIYYAAGQIYAVQDSPKSTTYQFTNANVENGNFNYNSSSRKVRHNIALVRYNDKNNFFKPAIEYAEDIDGIRKNGIRETEITAFGCTSRGQALRLGKWILATENLETETVSFAGGLEVSMLRPGDVISVSDQHRDRTTRKGGRTLNILSTEDLSPPSHAPTNLNSFATVTLDNQIKVNPNRIYNFSLLTPSFVYDSYNVSGLTSSDKDNIRRPQVQELFFQGSQVTTGVAGEKIHSIITFSGGYDFYTTGYSVTNKSVWTITPTGNDFVFADNIEEAVGLEQKYRIVNTKEQNNHKFGVTAVEYNEDKYNKIESDLKFESEGTIVIPNPPASITLKERGITNSSNTKLIDYRINPPSNQNGLSSYEVFVKRDNAWKIADYTGRYTSLFTTYTGNVSYMTGNVLPNDESYVPSREYRIAKIARPEESIATGSYLPVANDDYFFKVFSLNGVGQFSTDNARESIKITNTDPIKDVIISNLRLTQDTETGNAAGTADNNLANYTGASPKFLWDTSIDNLGVVTSKFDYRISVRSQQESTSSPNTPTNTIYYKESGVSPELTENGSNSFVFDITKNAVSNTNPIRKYDIIVEAHDEVGNSSAGGAFSPTTDTVNYSNSQGYEVARVSNKPITNPYLSSSISDCPNNQDFCTDQNLQTDGRVKIEFLKNNYKQYNGLDGAFIYFSKDTFDTSTVQGKVTADFEPGGSLENIQRLRVNNFNDTLYAKPTGDSLDLGRGYTAYSLYNKFDSDLETAKLTQSSTNPIYDANYDLGSKLPVSNVEKITLLEALFNAGGQGKIFKSVHGGPDYRKTQRHEINWINQIGNRTYYGTKDFKAFSETIELPEGKEWLFFDISIKLGEKVRREFYRNDSRYRENYVGGIHPPGFKILINGDRIDNRSDWVVSPNITENNNYIFFGDVPRLDRYGSRNYNGIDLRTDNFATWGITQTIAIKGNSLESFRASSSLKIELFLSDLFIGDRYGAGNYSNWAVHGEDPKIRSMMIEATYGQRAS